VTVVREKGHDKVEGAAEPGRLHLVVGHLQPRPENVMRNRFYDNICLPMYDTSSFCSLLQRNNVQWLHFKIINC
jgi:hypothetical protein